MRIVVDLGCLEREGANSITALVNEYNPDIIYAFDPSLLLSEAPYMINETQILPKRSAAWINDGVISFLESGWISRVNVDSQEVCICFDFSNWLLNLKADEIFVKMDIEGAEVPILEKMIEDGTDCLIDELLVEWHGQEVEGLRCLVREWWM